MKPLTALFALASGAISSEEPIACQGYLKLPATNGTIIRCWARHDDVTLEQAIAQSCDVYFYESSLRYGKWPPPGNEGVLHWLQVSRLQILSRFEHMQRAFGLGGGTGIDLPGEETGYVNEGSGQVTDLPYTAIGQNEVFTPLELAVYTSAIANDGVRVVPHVVASIGSLRYTTSSFKNVIDQGLGIKADDLISIQRGMWMACNDRLGTAYHTFHDDKRALYEVAGKTGTAETGVSGFDNAVFIGYAPYDHPQIAIAVVVPGGGHGADSTGPIARAMFDRFFAKLSRKS